MRIRVTYATSYAYQADARSILQVLRLTPRSHDSQHVVSWHVDTDADVRLKAGEDAFGNIVHLLATDRPVGGLTITVRGEVRTADTNGVVGRTTERLPSGIFLRQTGRTEPDVALRELAETIARDAGPEPLSRLHQLLDRLHETVTFEPGATDVAATAAAAYAIRRGVCQDFSHIFLAVARRMGIPARYVSGHLVREDEAVDRDAGHAWAEALVPGLGWIGFDAANGVCPTDAHVRVAVGLDYLDAAPIRGARNGGGEETMAVRLKVEGQQ